VDVAPMALYNAFRAAYPGVNEPVLLIDIGAKATDLLYIEGKRFFTRSVNRGGVSITSAIAKEYGIPFAEAEAHKTQTGLVALGGGHTEQLDETTAALATTIRNALGQLPAEISRTTNYYRSQHGGNAPKRIILAGGGANLPYTKEFFEEKLHLPVEFFNPIGAISVGKGVDTDKLGREAHLMGELVGLGLRGIGKSSINIDLVPTKVQAARTADKQKPFFIGAAALFLAGLAVWGVMTTLAASKAKQEAEGMAEQQANLESIANPIKAQFKKQDQLVQLASQYTGAEDDRTFWLDALQELKAGFASEAVWITDFEPLHNYDPLGGDDKTKAGKSVVRSEFPSAQYGGSGLEAIKVDVAPVKGGAKGKLPAGEIVPTANAVRIKGFWRANQRGSNIVLDLLKRLQAKPEHFKFTAMATPEKGKPAEVELTVEQLVKQLDSAPAAEDFAASFELVIPLSREVPIK
jgi:hypothetical protein